MSPTTNSKALLPHEINQIDQIFVDVLRGLGLSRNSEAAEVIARRLISCYQGGTRESGALKYIIGFYKSAAMDGNPNVLRQGNREVSMQEIAGGLNSRISQEELDMLQRTFDRVCTWCSIPRYGKPAERLARDIADQYRKGLSDEVALFDNAMWLQQTSHSAKY